MLTWCGPPDCDTCSFCHVLVPSCLFPSPYPVVVFLQLCDMRATVLDTCEGEVQGKRPPPCLSSLRPPAGPPRSALHPACGSDPHAASSRCLLGLHGSCQARSSSGFWYFSLVLSGWGESQAAAKVVCSAHFSLSPHVSSPVLSLWLSSGGITDLFVLHVTHLSYRWVPVPVSGDSSSCTHWFREVSPGSRRPGPGPSPHHVARAARSPPSQVQSDLPLLRGKGWQALKDLQWERSA